MTLKILIIDQIQITEKNDKIYHKNAVSIAILSSIYLKQTHNFWIEKNITLIKLHFNIKDSRWFKIHHAWKARFYVKFIYTGVEVEFSFLPFVDTIFVCLVSNPAFDFFRRLCKLDCVNGPNAGAVWLFFWCLRALNVAVTAP